MDPRVVLLIDADPGDRLLAARALQQAFPGVDCRAIDGRGALDAALATGGFDAVVTEYQLPWSSGLPVLRALRERHPGVPVVVFTGSGSEEACAAVLREGAQDYVVKKAGHHALLPAALRAGMDALQARRAAHDRGLDLQAQLDAERLAREQAERADRLKDEFLSVLSHELRTPLNAILGWAHVLRRAPDKPETVARGAQVIERNVKAQVRLIEDLLDVSRIVSGNLHLDARPVDLAAVVEAAIGSVVPAADIRGVRILRHVDRDAGCVLGDAARLQQVAWNLLSNAIQFTPHGGRIEVLLRRAGDRAALAVADTGEGIDPQVLPHLFDRPRQDAPTVRAHGGLGLGLSIVRQLVALHGGEVHADSAGRGRGSCFTVELPLAAGAGAAAGGAAIVPAAALASPAAVDLHDVRVLLVDDEADARELMQRVLADAGAQVALAASAEEAFGAYRHARPDVLVSDIGMPGEDGYALIGRVRRFEDGAGPRVPAIALTAFARAEDRRKALLAGFQLHIGKPIEPAELTAAIASLAGRTGA